MCEEVNKSWHLIKFDYSVYLLMKGFTDITEKQSERKNSSF